MPDFQDFEFPGKELERHELSYKRQMIDRYAREMGNERARQLIKDGKTDEVIDFLRKISGGLVQYQNWRNSLEEDLVSGSAILNAMLDVAPVRFPVD